MRPDSGECLADAVNRVSGTLAAAGVEAARDEARRLVAAVLGIDTLRLVVDATRPLELDECAAVDAALARRAAREPLSRILSERDFYGRTFEVTPDTLDPRADTETLITAALELAVEEGWRDRPIRILDVGTGTGCLLLTLLAELPLATGLATDISPAALAVARRNAARLGLPGRAAFREAHFLQGIPGTFDLVVSNPPYIPAGDIAGLEPEVRRHDPRLALDGGPDGLAAYRDIAAGLGRALPDGWVIFEVGAGQAADVAAVITSAPRLGNCVTRSWEDLGGHTRVVAGRTRNVMFK